MGGNGYVQRMVKISAPAPVGRWGKREQGILEVATSLYAQGGYENITMAAVATAAGLSEGTLYNYFRDKQDLQLRVSLGVFESYTLEMERVVAESKSLRHGLEGIIAVELRLLIGAKELFRIWLREMRSASGYAHSDARKVLRRFSNQLIQLFAKWNAVPAARLGLNLPLMRDIVFGSLEHIVWTAMVQRREDEIDVQRMSRDLAAAYLRAFGFKDEGARTHRGKVVLRGAAAVVSNKRRKVKSPQTRTSERGTRHATSTRGNSNGAL
jgi:AcrR family transcriptional regulator